MALREKAMRVQPYLFFNGRCDEAIEFYQSALGAQVKEIMRFKDSPEPPQPGMVSPGWESKVMHACLTIGDTEVLASDGCGAEPASYQGFALAVQATDPAEAELLFRALGEGGQVRMPLDKTFFSPAFGMLADRFGVGWMVVTIPPA